jgi:hypothetical protein
MYQYIPGMYQYIPPIRTEIHTKIHTNTEGWYWYVSVRIKFQYVHYTSLMTALPARHRPPATWTATTLPAGQTHLQAHRVTIDQGTRLGPLPTTRSPPSQARLRTNLVRGGIGAAPADGRLAHLELIGPSPRRRTPLLAFGSRSTGEPDCPPPSALHAGLQPSHASAPPHQRGSGR